MSASMKPSPPAAAVSPRLQPDCARCCALCCVAPAFDAEQGFGFSKPAHTPCANLLADDRCAIHEELPARGFPACATFHCHGAGQWVTQRVFGGRSWRSSPQLARQMFRAYFRYRALHELMALLELAIPHAPAPEASPLRDCLASLAALCDSGGALADSLRLSDLRTEVESRLRAALPRASSRARAVRT